MCFPGKFTLSRIEWVTPSDCSFPLFVIPGLTRNPVFLSLKDQKIALLEQRVSNLEVVLVLCSYAMRYLSSEVP